MILGWTILDAAFQLDQMQQGRSGDERKVLEAASELRAFVNSREFETARCLHDVVREFYPEKKISRVDEARQTLSEELARLGAAAASKSRAQCARGRDFLTLLHRQCAPLLRLGCMAA
jgi:hypothetical protein